MQNDLAYFADCLGWVRRMCMLDAEIARPTFDHITEIDHYRGPRNYTSDYRDNLAFWHQECDCTNDIGWEIPYTACGSYVGNLINRANGRVIIDDVPSARRCYDSYWTDYVIATLATALDEDDTEAVLDIVASLTQYPVLSDDEWSQVESEGEQEAWDTWLADDFYSEVADRLGDIDRDAVTNDVAFGIVSERAHELGLWITEYDARVVADLERLTGDLAEGCYAAARMGGALAIT